MNIELKEKYKTNFLGSILIMKITINNTIILENRTFKNTLSPTRIIKKEIKENKSEVEQYRLLLKKASDGLDSLNEISFLKWERLR